MKVNKVANFLVIALVLSVAAVGCKKKPTGVTPLPNQRAGTVGGGDLVGGGTVSEGGGVEAGGGALSPRDISGMTQDRAALAGFTVYFDFDSSVVKSSEQDKVASIASALNAEPDNMVLVEGHCDERGTEGYNLALGEKRALALREALAGKGIDPERVHTISYGEERPANPNHDEMAWSENRRGVFVLLLP